MKFELTRAFDCIQLDPMQRRAVAWFAFGAGESECGAGRAGLAALEIWKVV